MNKYVRKGGSVNAFMFTRASNLKAIEAFLGGGYNALIKTPRSFEGVSTLHLTSRHNSWEMRLYEGDWCVLTECGVICVYSDATFKRNFKEDIDYES